MKNILKKIFFREENNSLISKSFSKLKNYPGVIKIFQAFENFDKDIEIRFVGGCVRKILNKDDFDDIDLAVNIEPIKVKSILIQNKINYYESGIEHGTITAIINKKKFEITSLRKDVSTDGRHAVVEFSNDWEQDAYRRDFTINSIYSDIDGNLFDPFDGKKDLSSGLLKFIGSAEKRIQEDYLRILRYLRFFLIYSKINHTVKIKTAILKNIAGIKKVSKERLLDELKKIFLNCNLEKLSNDKFCSEVMLLIFPEFKNLHIFKSLNDEALEIIKKKDFTFILSLLIIDETDNADYFLFKYNLPKQSREKVIFLKNNFQNIFSNNYFNETNLKKIYYETNKHYLEDLIDFKIFKTKKISKKIIDLKNFFSHFPKPIFPIKAKYLIDNYNLKEGVALGQKLNKLEKMWINNNFKISNKEIEIIARD